MEDISWTTDSIDIGEEESGGRNYDIDDDSSSSSSSNIRSDMCPGAVHAWIAQNHLLVGMESCRITTATETDDARGTAAVTTTISGGYTLITATLVDHIVIMKEEMTWSITISVTLNALSGGRVPPTKWFPNCICCDPGSFVLSWCIGYMSELDTNIWAYEKKMLVGVCRYLTCVGQRGNNIWTISAVGYSSSIETQIYTEHASYPL